MTESATPFALVTMDRFGVDLHSPQSGVPLTLVQTFGESLGGSAAAVAVPTESEAGGLLANGSLR